MNHSDASVHRAALRRLRAPVNMVALDIGPDAPLSTVKSLLANGESDGRWYYEEACISDEWRQLP